MAELARFNSVLTNALSSIKVEHIVKQERVPAPDQVILIMVGLDGQEYRFPQAVTRNYRSPNVQVPHGFKIAHIYMIYESRGR